MKTHFFLFKARVDPETGNDIITCVNPDGKGFDKDALNAAVREVYIREAPTAGPEDGIIIQRVKRLFPGISAEHEVALTYDELVERPELREDCMPSGRVG